MRDHFKPEFLNRVDEIIVFHRLDKADLEKIVEVQLRGLASRVEARGFTLKVMPGARTYLADAGYDPAYGARPLKRLIQREIENELAMRLLDGTFMEGDEIEIDAVDGALVFSKDSERTPA